MSQRSYNFNIYQGLPIEHIDLYNIDTPEEDIKSLYFQMLQKGMHGICFSLYEDGQKPGDIISEGQIRRRLEILKPYTNWIRSFSTIEGNELIPKIAKEMGMKTLVGAWLGDDKEKNEIEVENLIQLCNDGFVDIAAVGNEVLYRNDLTLAELLEKIDYVKSQVSEIPVGYVDAYYEFGRHPELVDASDVVLANYYPFWEGTSFENSLGHLHYMHQQVIDAAKGKKIIITETGWPSQGEVTKGAIPNAISTMKYFINVQIWAQQSEIEMFYFSSFDESWKVGAEGEVGAYWGLWDKNERLKFVQ
ncbi:MAG: glycosyl hydrolase [Saprospiraceae bacterium]|nr:glycosyl hydrolase [Saprospiraceae bacterium]